MLSKKARKTISEWLFWETDTQKCSKILLVSKFWKIIEITLGMEL